MRLSRRDRAALVLALECLRRDIWHADHEDAFAALRAGDARAYGLAHDAWTAWGRIFRREACADHRDIMREKQRTWRILRARLALALRVLLRADAGDLGRRWWHCSAECGAGDLTRHPPPDGASCIHCDEGAYVYDEYEPIRPLWERALTDADVEAIAEALARRGVRQDGGSEMGYAENVMLIREAESETEIVMERMDVDGDALELRVTIGYGSPASARVGHIRLQQRHLDALAEWIDDLREIRRAEENAPQSDE